MNGYVLGLVAALMFFATGGLYISSGSVIEGCALVALGCAFFAVALVGRKKRRKK